MYLVCSGPAENTLCQYLPNKRHGGVFVVGNSQPKRAKITFLEKKLLMSILFTNFALFLTTKVQSIIMKRFFGILLMLICTTISALSVNVSVHFNNGLVLDGILVSRTDSTIVVTPLDANPPKDIVIKTERVQYFDVRGVGRFYSENGKFVPSKKAQTKLEKKQVKQNEIMERNRILAANPNEVIGKAFQSTGTICMSVGIPSLITGAVLLGVGSIKVEGTNEEDLNKSVTYGRCAAAGYVLLPMGASLTIVGIPFYAHGKRIAELKFNYTGNGAGIAMNF